MATTHLKITKERAKFIDLLHLSFINPSVSAFKIEGNAQNDAFLKQNFYLKNYS